jgi:endonuclease/exonuclease/phosphatase family metal-dependent hydrolase
MPRRITAANQLYDKAMDILHSDAMAKILIMGDFNDLPVSKSIAVHLNSRAHQAIKFNEFYNLAHRPYKKKMGSLYAKNRWLMFDQMLISTGMMVGEGVKVTSPRLSIHYDKGILFYDKQRSIYRPNRTYSGKKYHGGFSDHLPVYLYLNME